MSTTYYKGYTIKQLIDGSFWIDLGYRAQIEATLQSAKSFIDNLVGKV